jgi:hypothetical protein
VSGFIAGKINARGLKILLGHVDYLVFPSAGAEIQFFKVDV